jgi:D-alanyl-D-alanine carboxypeptidase
VALAEKVAGSEEAFAARMTATARDLGMARTVFRNASGLPHDGTGDDGARLAVLASALLRDYPKHYPLFNQRAVTIGKRSRGTVNGSSAAMPARTVSRPASPAAPATTWWPRQRATGDGSSASCWAAPTAASAPSR